MDTNDQNRNAATATSLVELARRNGWISLDGRILDAAAGAGRHLVALAQQLYEDPRLAGETPSVRIGRALARLRFADTEDRGAAAALKRWAHAFEVELAPELVDGSYGDPLAFDGEPVQASLFEETTVPRPPSVFETGKYDLVVADVPRHQLTTQSRDFLRERFAAAAGHFSFEAPFIERVLGLTGPDGVAVIRVRSAVLRRDFGRHLVEDVLAHTEVLAIEPDRDHVLLAIRRHGPPTGAAIIRAFGSEDAARGLRTMRAASATTLGEAVSGPIGRTSTPGCDDVWEVPDRVLAEVPTVPMVRGEDLGAWYVRRFREVVWPYDGEGRRRDPQPAPVIEWLGKFRSLLEARRMYGQSLERRGLRWHDFLEHHADRWRDVPSLVIARNGVHPRCAVIRRPVVVSGSAVAANPIDGDRAETLAGLLNSSVAAFWFKHAFHVYETSDGRAFEVTGAGLAEFPLPAGGLDDVRDIAQKLDRLGRSIAPLENAIEGEPDELQRRLASIEEANVRVATEMCHWRNELDWAVYAAYGFVDEYVQLPFRGPDDADEAERERVELARDRIVEDRRELRLFESAEYKASVEQRQVDVGEVLRGWLSNRVEKAFLDGDLPGDRPLSAAEVADWIRGDALARAVLAAAEVSTQALLYEVSIPFETGQVFSPRGLERLRARADGEPVTFTRQDFAAVAISVPPEAPSTHQRRVFGLRGRYNVPRERFVHLVELSEKMNRPLFAWAGASHEERARLADRVDEAPGGAQLDLERMLDMRTELATAGAATTAEIADALWARGWTFREVQLALSVLEQSGAVQRRDGSWSLE